MSTPTNSIILIMFLAMIWMAITTTTINSDPKVKSAEVLSWVIEKLNDKKEKINSKITSQRSKRNIEVWKIQDQINRLVTKRDNVTSLHNNIINKSKEDLTYVEWILSDATKQMKILELWIMAEEQISAMDYKQYLQLTGLSSAN